MKTWQRKLLQKGLKMTQVIIKRDVNKYLFKVLGNQFMVDSWWNTENLHFDFDTPENVYQSGPEGRKKVLDLVSNSFAIRE